MRGIVVDWRSSGASSVIVFLLVIKNFPTSPTVSLMGDEKGGTRRKDETLCSGEAETRMGDL